jgi:hypothetical protein
MCIADDEQRMLMGFTILGVVYTGGQMLEKHPKNRHFRHFLGPSARLPGGTARSASSCDITRSDMISAGPDHPKTDCVWVHRKCHIDFHGLYTISRGSEWHVSGATLRCGPAPDTGASSRMPVRRSQCDPPALLCEQCRIAEVSPRSPGLPPLLNRRSGLQDLPAGPAVGPTCGERHQHQIDCAVPELKLIVSRLCAETSVDSRPNAARESRRKWRILI